MSGEAPEQTSAQQNVAADALTTLGSRYPQLRTRQPVPLKAATEGWTIEEVKSRFAPPHTLGETKESRLAMDAQLAGVYSLLRHTNRMGFGLGAGAFIGYAALQELSQNGMIRACIETIADDMTREWIELSDGDKDADGDGKRDANQDDTLIKDIEAKAEDLKLKQAFHDAMELVGYEGGSFIFIDTGAQGSELLNPLDVSEHSGELGKGKPIRFRVIDPISVTPGNYNSTNPLADNYFAPVTWRVLGTEVHKSRMIRLVENEPSQLLKASYNFLGIPRAQILMDYVAHFQMCRTAAQKMLTKYSLTVFKTKLTQTLAQVNGLNQLDARLRLLSQNQSNDSVFAIDMQDEDVAKVESSMAGATDIVRQSLEIIAAINGTPAVKLLGISPQGFNSTGESDIINFYDRIRAQQEKVLRDGIARCLDVIQLHLRGKINPKIKFEFAPLGNEDKQAAVSTVSTLADSMTKLIQSEVITAEEARKRLHDMPNSGFEDLELEPDPQEEALNRIHELVDDIGNPANRIGELTEQAEGAIADAQQLEADIASLTEPGTPAGNPEAAAGKSGDQDEVPQAAQGAGEVDDDQRGEGAEGNAQGGPDGSAERADNPQGEEQAESAGNDIAERVEELTEPDDGSGRDPREDAANQRILERLSELVDIDLQPEGK